MPTDTPTTPPSSGPGPTPVGLEPTPLGPDAGPGYYDVPMLKPPVWKSLVAWYLFLGGLSGGAYVTARLAERFGGRRMRAVGTVGTCVAAAAALPCAPLLIADLGDPKRFHHMLRVFKPGSPMNLGAWVLTAYHGAGAAALAREWLRWGRPDDEPADFVRDAADGLLVAVADVAGAPLALLLASYTGVLLTGGSAPVWCRSTWLPALFTASAMSSGSAAVSLVLEALAAAGVEVGAGAARAPLHTLHTTAHLAEAVALAGYLSTAGRPIAAGPLAGRAWGTLAAIAGAELLQRLPEKRSRLRPWFEIGSSVLSLIGAYNLRSTLIQAGRASAADPRSRH